MDTAGYSRGWIYFICSILWSVALSPGTRLGAVPTFLRSTPRLLNHILAILVRILVAWVPLGFRGTCYYYRKAYYRAFFWDPPACAIEEPRIAQLPGGTQSSLDPEQFS